MWRALLRILGVAIGGYALLLAALAAVFRIDSGAELEWSLQMDVVVGFGLGAAVVLVRVPAVGAGTARWHGLTALVAVLVWAVVSGGLTWSHLDQVRKRSTLPVMLGPSSRLNALLPSTR
jgi:hypothetical protein